METIYEHEMKLARTLRDGMSQIEGVTLYCADMDRNHLPVIAFNTNVPNAGKNCSPLSEE